MSFWADLKGAVSAVVKALSLTFEAIASFFTVLNGSLSELNRSLAEHNESMKIPALEARVKIFEHEIELASFYNLSRRINPATQYPKSCCVRNFGMPEVGANPLGP